VAGQARAPLFISYVYPQVPHTASPVSFCINTSAARRRAISFSLSVISRSSPAIACAVGRVRTGGRVRGGAAGQAP